MVKKISWTFFFLLCALASNAFGTRFFRIEEVRVDNKPGERVPGVWLHTKDTQGATTRVLPSVRVRVSTRETIHSSKIVAKAYFVSAQGEILATALSPSPAVRSPGHQRKGHPFPVMFHSGKSSHLYFEIPEKLQGGSWRFIAVFGDKKEIAATIHPAGNINLYDFPEKKLALQLIPQNEKREKAEDQLIEHKVRTTNPRHPEITLFLRMPKKISSPSDIKGVIALCVLASSVEEMKRRLQDHQNPELGITLNYADANQLAVVCWGARTLWRPGASHDELEKETNLSIGASFDQVANAWERGVQDLHRLYGIPKRDFMLWGVCGAAQWGHRLVMRKSDYFLAAYIHIPSSFDRPTKDAARVLWLLTTGELDSGYERGGRFYRHCISLGYPIIYKPIPNLGHAGSPIADQLAVRLFDYALTLREQRQALDVKWQWLKRSGHDLPQRPWIESYSKPLYYGDFLNQVLVESSKKQRIPEALRVPLPTKAIADAWNR